MLGVGAVQLPVAGPTEHGATAVHVVFAKVPPKPPLAVIAARDEMVKGQGLCAVTQLIAGSAAYLTEFGGRLGSLR